MPTWVKVAIDAWTAAAGIADGHVFRPVNGADQVGSKGLDEKVVWQLIKPYPRRLACPESHLTTCAKLCRAAGGELEQIQLLLSHASIQTTERCLGTK
jgi:hypothetical protein